MHNIAIILARSGSKRIHKKNTKFFFKKESLLEILIKKLILIEKLNLIICSSNCNECKRITLKYNLLFHERSEENSSDSASSIDSIREVLDFYKIKNANIYLFQCTSPFIKVKTIKNFIENTEYDQSNTVFASGHISKEDIWTIDNKRVFLNEPRNQQNRKGFYVENSAFYKFIQKSGDLFFDLNKFLFYKIPTIEGFDINTELDWEIAKMLKEKDY